MKDILSRNAQLSRPAAARAAALCLAVLAVCCSAPSAFAGIERSTMTVQQIYAAPKFRDPFLVSTMYGDEHAPKSRASTGSVVPSTFTVDGLYLIGIMEDSRGKEALLSDKAAGSAYFLKGGRLFDAQKKPVPGVTGVIKGKQVILMTADKRVRQLNLREKE